jgi:hypothetical protein
VAPVAPIVSGWPVMPVVGVAGVAPPEDVDELDGCTLDQLKALVDSEELQVSTAIGGSTRRTKVDIIRDIRMVRAGNAPHVAAAHSRVAAAPAWQVAGGDAGKLHAGANVISKVILAAPDSIEANVFCFLTG